MTQDILSSLIEALPAIHEFHAPSGSVLGLLRAVARREIAERFSTEKPVSRAFGPFGELAFPYRRMGAIDSLDLFGIDELVIFAFYHANRRRYRCALDLGANLGLHSIIMARCGFAVRSYEPDPLHSLILERNLALNGIATAAPVNAAVSNLAGRREFIRVLGNTTGSHLAGAKANVYGETERFEVDVVPFGDIVRGADLVKMDVEGHEAAILCETTHDLWRGVDAVVEIGSDANAAMVYEHFRGIGVGLFAQKTGWRRVDGREDMPTSYRDGSLFITVKDRMPWG